MRTLVLLLLLGIVVSVLGKVSLFAQSKESDMLNFDLPDTISLKGWRSISSQALKDRDSEQPNYWTGKEYFYTRGSVTLTIQARYFVKTNGDVQGFISDHLASYLSGRETWQTQEIEEIGSFLISSRNGETQLSSCINPYGGSTVTIREFQWNRNFQDIRYRFIPWLFGEPLKDERCLWTHISISAREAERIDASDLRDTAWLDWYNLWVRQLPKLKNKTI
jgi:cyanosortase A-associated protein